MAISDTFLHPLACVSATASTYSTLFTAAQCLQPGSLNERDGRFQAQAFLKAISSFHATVTTGLALYALYRPWIVERGLPPLNLGLGKSVFDDLLNPMIAGRSTLGNAVTGLETGYLVFDTLALIYLSRQRLQDAHSKGSPASTATTSNLATAFAHLAKSEPLTLTHHLTLATGLGILQNFIARGRERGVYIITAFILMNASTPLLHLRWYRRKRTGRSSLILDAALAVVFAAARLSVIWWVLGQYGKWHGVSAWQTLRGQRWVCQAGTGALGVLNAVWLGRLVRGIGGRVLALVRDGRAASSG